MTAAATRRAPLTAAQRHARIHQAAEQGANPAVPAQRPAQPPIDRDFLDMERRAEQMLRYSGEDN